MLDLGVFKQLVMESQDGITISDVNETDCPIIFANPGFERLTGYIFEDIAGQNCRFLQADDKDQSGIKVIRETIENESSCLVTLRNYRNDKSMFWNELSLSPVHNENGKLEYYIGIQKDVTTKILYTEQLASKSIQLKEMNQQLNTRANIDSLTGVYKRQYFDQQLTLLWRFAERTHSLLTIFMIDIDFFEKYKFIYGHIAGDNSLRLVANTLSDVFRRTSDFIARYSDKGFVIAAYSMSDTDAKEYAENLRDKIHNLHIINSASTISDYLTISIGYASMAPVLGARVDKIVERAESALAMAIENGKNQVAIFDK